MSTSEMVRADKVAAQITRQMKQIERPGAIPEWQRRRQLKRLRNALRVARKPTAR